LQTDADKLDSINPLPQDCMCYVNLTETAIEELKIKQIAQLLPGFDIYIYFWELEEVEM